MNTDRAMLLASVIVVATGGLWGLYWLPVRRLSEAGLPGAWGTLAAAGVAVLALAPGALRRRQALRRASPFALLFIALGGAAFVLYSVALVHGRVAIIILMFYLTPVWSTLIGRFVMGWRSPPLRLLAIALGLAGLLIMLGSDGGVPLPRNTGEWFALVSGVLWSISLTGVRARSDLGAAETGFVLVLGAFLTALVLAPFLAPLPLDLSSGLAPTLALGPAVGWTLAAGGLWWALFMTSLMWATARLEPTRVGILLMSEVLVGALSGALLAGEPLGGQELAGGALVLGAAALEVWPTRKPARLW